METSSFDPRAVFDEIVESLTPCARAKGLALTALIYDNVPARLRGDAKVLRQTLSHLAQNAIVLTSRGQVTLSLAREGETDAVITLRFAVSDTRTGLDSTAREPISGCLSGAHRLIAPMSVASGVESAPGQGSTFWFTARFEKAAQSIGAVSPRRAAKPVGRQGRLLVAEDDPINQQMTRHHLARLGYEADVVGSGAEVLESLDRTRYDLIFLDCQMPVLDGCATAREIRRREASHEPFLVALTSLNSPLNRQKCRDAGMDDFLSKPIERGALRACLGRWLGHFHDQGDAEAENQARETEFLAQLIPLFLEDAPARLNSMRAALEGGDPRALEQAAHTLKSSSALLGAAPMSQMCEALEAQGESGSLHGAHQALQELEIEFGRVRRNLEEQLGSKDHI